jgi:predicted amidophosphoribosyltransferase
MADPTTGTAPRCQWCSAPLPAADLDICPSCGATLSSAPDTGEIRGVTTLDTEAILRSRSEASRPRSRLLSFITGEEPVELGGPE